MVRLSGTKIPVSDCSPEKELTIWEKRNTIIPKYYIFFNFIDDLSNYIGKLVERQGRKAMGLRTVVYDCQVADSMRIVIAAQSGMTGAVFILSV